MLLKLSAHSPHRQIGIQPSEICLLFFHSSLRLINYKHALMTDRKTQHAEDYSLGGKNLLPSTLFNLTIITALTDVKLLSKKCHKRVKSLLHIHKCRHWLLMLKNVNINMMNSEVSTSSCREKSPKGF